METTQEGSGCGGSREVSANPRDGVRHPSRRVFDQNGSFVRPGESPRNSYRPKFDIMDDLMTSSTRPFWHALTLASLALTGCSGGDLPPASGLAAGQYARIELEASYPEAFSFLNGVREMADGSILAADPLSQVVLRLDLAAGTADTLGQVGEGPQEYMQPDQVFPLPGDSTLLVDIGKVQLTVIGPDGMFYTGMKIASASDEGQFTVVLPQYVDSRGLIYMRGNRGMDGPMDSTEVSRYDRATEEATTMGWAWQPEPIVTRSGDNVSMTSIQMAARDDWAVGPDGQFAIIRADGFVVEWYYPDGRVVTGPPNSVETPRISDEDKFTFLEQRSSDGLMMMVSMSEGGAADMSMRRGGGGMGGNDEPNLRDYEWAEVYAPFRPDRARVSPRGDLWVERWLPPQENPQIDVFDGEGVKLGSVELPPQRRIIGFGLTAGGDPALYMVRTDEFDLKWLERYRIVR